MRWTAFAGCQQREVVKFIGLIGHGLHTHKDAGNTGSGNVQGRGTRPKVADRNGRFAERREGMSFGHVA